MSPRNQRRAVSAGECCAVLALGFTFTPVLRLLRVPTTAYIAGTEQRYDTVHQPGHCAASCILVSHRRRLWKSRRLTRSHHARDTSTWALCRLCTCFRHLLKLESEAPVKVYASSSLISGRSSNISTACSALMVPAAGRFDPSDSASVRMTWYFWRRRLFHSCAAKTTNTLARTTNSSHGGGLCVVTRGGHIEGDLHVVCRHVPRAPLTACFIVCVAKPMSDQT